MRNDVGKFPAPAVLGERLVLIDIEPRGGDVAGFEGGEEGRFLDDAAPRAIEEADALLALRERGVVDHVARVIGQRHVDA